MAAKTTGEAMKDSIVEKVKSVLDNAEHPASIHIEIVGESGNLPIIKYNIQEVIHIKEVCVNDEVF